MLDLKTNKNGMKEMKEIKNLRNVGNDLCRRPASSPDSHRDDKKDYEQSFMSVDFVFKIFQHISP
jgi:hypothetical protein